MATTPRKGSGSATPPHRPPPSGPEGRGYVSPLGGQTAPFSTDNQKRQEQKNRAQTATKTGLDAYGPGRRGR
jgi:hypothetical protein